MAFSDGGDRARSHTKAIMGCTRQAENELAERCVAVRGWGRFGGGGAGDGWDGRATEGRPEGAYEHAGDRARGAHDSDHEVNEA